MTITKRFFTAALALAFVLTLIALPAPAHAADPTGLSLDASGDVTVENGDTHTFNATLTVADAEEHTVEWTIGGEKASAIASLDKSTTTASGTDKHTVILTAEFPGTVTVTAQALDGNGNAISGAKKTCKVIVRQELTLDSANGDSATLEIGSGAKGTATADVSPSGFDSSDYYRIDWSSSNEKAVKISGTSKTAPYVPISEPDPAVTIGAKLVPNGPHFYTKHGSDAFTVEITSSDPYLTIDKDPSSTITSHGYPGTVTVTLVNAPAGEDAAVSWKNSASSVIKETSKDTEILTGSTDASYYFNTVKNGSATITATVTVGGKKLTKSVTVKVNKPMPFLTLDGDNHMTASNRNITLTAKLDDNGTNTYDGDERIHWSSSNDKLVSIISHDQYLRRYEAEAVIRSHYNGTGIKINVWMGNNDDISAYHTVYVTGLTYLPQTGQDTTLLYVIGGLCVLMFASAGVLYARRKKHENA